MQIHILFHVIESIFEAFYPLRMRVWTHQPLPQADGPYVQCFTKNALVWADVWEVALLWWNMIVLWSFVFLSCPKTSCKHMAVYYSNLASCGRLTQMFPHCRLWRRYKPLLDLKYILRQELLLELTRLGRRIQSIHLHSSKIRHQPWSNRRLLQYWQDLF